MRSGGAVERRITGFHQDDVGDWVAELECGHQQHMRHQPPWQVRPWVVTPEGRESFIGTQIPCPHCDASRP
jgi:hypothetical protein